MSQSPPPMVQYVIYDHPLDEPDAYVVRRWFIYPARVVAESEIWLKSTSLDDARASIPEGCVRLARSHLDDPKIIEVWL